MNVFMGKHFHQQMRPFLHQDSSHSVTQLTHCQLGCELFGNFFTSFLEESLDKKDRITQECSWTPKSSNEGRKQNICYGIIN